MKYVLVALLLVGCSSPGPPTMERYKEDLEAILEKHEDMVLIRYGEPTRVIELSEGSKVLVYEGSPYYGAPSVGISYKECRTAFVITPERKIQGIRADGNACIK